MKNKSPENAAFRRRLIKGLGAVALTPFLPAAGMAAAKPGIYERQWQS